MSVQDLGASSNLYFKFSDDLKTNYTNIDPTQYQVTAQSHGLVFNPQYSGLNLNQDKATKPQTVQIVRQGEATPYWFKVNPLYISLPIKPNIIKTNQSVHSSVPNRIFRLSRPSVLYAHIRRNRKTFFRRPHTDLV